MSEKAIESALPVGPSTVAGVPVVTIPLAEYEELLRLRKLHGNPAGQVLLPPPTRSRIERDKEVAEFLNKNLGRMLLKEIHAACVEKFGAARTPSKSAINRYHVRHMASRRK
ncbi:hypothetical protein [Methylocystis parvus]|uniref:hypothetical protein n=1 Tax=Methylocystis parvus TaxID=134 RepID=UPI003C758BC1